MTQLLNSQVQARLELYEVEGGIYELSIKKGNKITVIILTEAEAKTIGGNLNLIIQNS